MSPCSFSLEYLSFPRINPSNVGCLSSSSSNNSPCSNTVAPTRLMWRIPELSPSSISIEIATRLRGNLSTLVSIPDPYRPWATYCLSSSMATRSSVDCLNISPSRSPCSARPSNKDSSLIALLPSIWITSIAGRSSRVTISTSPSRAIVMSSKYPVRNKPRIS